MTFYKLLDLDAMGAVIDSIDGEALPSYPLAAEHLNALVDAGVLEIAELMPSEKIALKVGFSQIERGEEAMPNIAAVCIMALNRLMGDS